MSQVFGYSKAGWKKPPIGGSGTGSSASSFAQQFLGNIQNQMHGTYKTLVYKVGSTYYAEDWVGNPVSSLTTAQNVLQAAFNRGGKCYIKDATYPTTSQLTVPSNTELVFESWSALIQGAGSHILLTNANASNANIKVIGGAFDGQNGTASHGNIYFEAVTNAEVSGCKSINSPKEGIKFRNGFYSIATNNYVEKTPTGAAGIISATGNLYTNISNNHIVDAGGEGIGSYQNSGNTNIIGNTSEIITAGRGHILVEGTTGSEANSIAITGNNLTTDYYGINVISSNGIAITGNTLKSFSTNSLSGITLQGITDYVTVSANVIRDYGQHGIFIRDLARQISITGNTITNPSQGSAGAYNGIHLQPRGGSIKNITVVSNVVTDDQDSPTINKGLYFDLDTQTVSRGYFGLNTFQPFTSPGGGIGFDLGTTGELNSCCFRDNGGFSPRSLITSPFDTTDNEVGMPGHGSSSTYVGAPAASTSYLIVNTDILVTSTIGTGVSIEIKSPSGQVIVTGLATLTAHYIPRLYQINFGAFSVAPSVVVHAI